MSLYERVQRAGNISDEKPVTSADLLGKLKAEVQETVSIDELARLSDENPERARNEVRSACRRAFEGADWAYVSLAERGELVERLLDALFGFGVLEDVLADETITEIIANGPSKLFYERDGKLVPSKRRFSDVAELRALIDRILGPLGRRIDEASPMVNARLPQGHRVNVVVPPIALDGPYVTIRKFTEHVITLEEMEESGS